MRSVHGRVLYNVAVLARPVQARAVGASRIVGKVKGKMHLSYAILAEAADISRSGKLALIGGNSEVLNAAAFPVTLPMLTLVASLTVDAVECEVEHSATLQVLTADGSDLLPSTAHRFTPHANPPETAALPVRFVLLVNLAGTTLPAAGTYLIRLNVDGKEVGSIPILALHAADMQPSTPSPSEETSV